MWWALFRISNCVLCVGIDCTRKWIGNAVKNFSPPLRSHEKIECVWHAPLPPAREFELQSSVLSPEVDELTIQLPTLLLVVGAVCVEV